MAGKRKGAFNGNLSDTAIWGLSSRARMAMNVERKPQ